MELTSAMDKKLQSRPLPPQCKNQDTSKSGNDNLAKRNGNQYPRKRENEKSDGYKRSQANRGGRTGQRYVRPREKVGCQVDPKGPESEFGSLQRSGGRKQNITHLLNWWGPGPERHFNRGWSNDHGAVRGYRGRKYSAHHPKYNKEHYLQANCQFVVSAGHDYSSYEADPDHLVDWEFVEEVRLHASESPSCPICLHPPVAAKVTRCGHIFCFPCILHYLALTDEKWRKCPICFDAVSRNDLKSVITILHKDFASSHEIVMMLMRRERDSLIPVPVDNFCPSKEKRMTTLSSPPAVLAYSKLILASQNEVSKFIVAREMEALMCQLALEGDQPEACFIQEALSLVSHRDSLLNANIKERMPSLPEDASSPETAGTDHALFADGTCFENLRLDDFQGNIDVKSSKEGLPLHGKGRNESPKHGKSLEAEQVIANIQPEDLDIAQVAESEGSTPVVQDGKGVSKSTTHYFYQESSGAHIYLHAINVHMLVKEYGTLEKCPRLIRAKVLEKESESMTDTLRQRLRYLRHLPITCPFEVVEIEMKPPLVSQLTVADFEGQLEQRERKRKKRAKAEYRIEKRAQVEEDKLMGRSRGSKINMTSFKHFPSFTEDISPPQFPVVEEGGYAASPDSSSPADDLPDVSTPSFAQMIRCGQKKSPVVATEAFPSLGSGHPNRHPTPRVEVKGSPRRTNSGSDDDEDGERVPDFNTAFSDAFAKALDQATKKASEFDAAANPNDANSGGPCHRGKKGKKKKGIVLLSSGGR